MSKVIIGVYKITSPSGKVYIGSSANINKRFLRYKKLRCGAQIKLFNSLKKYGPETHTFEVMCECSIGELFDKEVHYGIEYNVLDKAAGLNLRLPKKTDHYSAISEETIERMSVGMKAFYDKKGRKSKEHFHQKKKEKDNRWYNKNRKISPDQQFENRSAASQAGWDNPGRKVKRLTRDEKKKKKYKYQLMYRANQKALNPVAPKEPKPEKIYKQSESHRLALSEARKAKGIASGANNPKAKLTAEIVREIRAKHAGGATLTDLFREYKMSKSGMHSILTGKNWPGV